MAKKNLYWVMNQSDGKAYIFYSLPIIAVSLGLSLATLKNKFQVNRLSDVTIYNYRICKRPVINNNNLKIEE